MTSRNDLVAALPPGWRDPDGWVMNQDGVWRRSGRCWRKPVTERPMVRQLLRPIWPSARFESVGGTYIEVSWIGYQGVMSRIMRSRRVLAGNVTILAGYDAPVCSPVAWLVGQWMTESLLANEGILPVRDLGDRKVVGR